MNRLTAWALHAATILLAVTGLIYAAMHYLMEPVDPFAVVNHPLEPYMLKLHIVLAPVLVLLIGIILHSHILLKAGNGVLHGRRSGLVLAFLFGVMAMSGYLLQVFTNDEHRILFWIHLGSGCIWALGYSIHQVASIRAKRWMAAQRKAAVIGLTVTIVILLAAGTLLAGAPEPVEREAFAMGTTLHVALYGNRPDRMQISESILQSVEDTEQQLSTWREDSELSRLNQHPVSSPFQLSPGLCRLLKRAKSWVETTGGSFDPGIGALAAAWDIHGAFRIPAKDEIEVALANTWLRLLQIDPETCIAIRTRDVRVDPGAFGKGEALDRAASLALDQGVEAFFFDFGGQVLARTGTREASEVPLWTVSIADPVRRNRSSSVRVRLNSGSLATSGDSERSGKVAGKVISHMLDPRTGQPVEPFGSVTVWSETALEADILSTALYVMGPALGIEWAEEFRVAACYLVVDKGRLEIRMTQEFQKLAN